MATGARTIDIAAVVNDRKLGGFNYRLILLSWFITVFDGFDMMMISFTAPYMRDELTLTTAQIGNIFSSGLFGMMVGGFVLAYVGDRIGRRRSIIAAAFAFGALTFATAFARSYETLLLLRFLDGLAIGGMLPLAWALNIEFVPTRMRSTVVTIIMMGYSIGTAAAGPVTVWLAPHYGWEGVFMFGGAATILCAIALFFFLPESIRFLVSKQRRPEEVARTLNRIDPTLEAHAGDRFVLSDEKATQHAFRVGDLFQGELRWLTPLLWTGYIASTLAVYFKSNWGPIVYEDLHFPRDVAAYASSISGVAGAGLGLLLMRFTDGKGPFAIAVYPLIAMPLLLVLGLADLQPHVFLPLSVLATSIVGGEHFGILSIAGVFYATSIRANGAGWATSVAKIGGIAGPILGAMVLTSGLPAVRSFAFLAVCPAILAVCAIGIGLVVRRRRNAPLIPPDAVPAS